MYTPEFGGQQQMPKMQLYHWQCGSTLPQLLRYVYANACQLFLHTWCPQTLLLPHKVNISISNKTFGWYFFSGWELLRRWSDSLIVLQWMNWSWNKNRDLKRSVWNEIILYVHQAHHLYNDWKLLKQIWLAFADNL